MAWSDTGRTEGELREQIHDLVRVRTRADAEARRLEERAGQSNDAQLSELAERYRRQAAHVSGEIDGLRTILAALEAEPGRSAS